MDWARVVNATYTSYVQENSTQENSTTCASRQVSGLERQILISFSKVRQDVKNLAGVSRKEALWILFFFYLVCNFPFTFSNSFLLAGFWVQAAVIAPSLSLVVMRPSNKSWYWIEEGAIIHTPVVLRISSILDNEYSETVKTYTYFKGLSLNVPDRFSTGMKQTYLC
jgi:hypothetical protein